MLETLRRALAALLDQRLTLVATRNQILTAPTAESRDLNATETTAFTEARAAIEALDTQISERQAAIARLEEDERRDQAASAALAQVGATRAPAGGARVGREPRTYDRGNGRSYFLDLARAQLRGDQDALGRLQRHAAELDVDLPAREARRAQRADAALDQIEGVRPEHRGSVYERETRVNPNRTDGQGGYFVPPLWLIDQYIDLPRFGRTIANAVKNMDLPAGTDSINLPKIATGTATAVQTADAGPIQSTDLTDTFVNAPVRTIAGQQDVAMQILDQSPVAFDEIIFGDLHADLNQKLDLQVINGSGINGQCLGILNVSGINSVTSTAGSTTLITLYPKMIQLLSQIAKNRKMMPTGIFTTPTRWFWSAATLDTANRPLILPDANFPMNPMGIQDGSTEVEGPVGRLLSTVWQADGNIPVTLGGGTEDRIIALRAPDLYLWEGTVRTRALSEVLSGTLQVRFQVYEYFAFMGNRRPESISVLSGSDLAASFTSGF